MYLEIFSIRSSFQSFIKIQPNWRRGGDTSYKINFPSQSQMVNIFKFRKECHRFSLRLRHAVLLILNDRTSASKKINGMALICTLTVSTTAFERTREKFYGFRQTEFTEETLDICCQSKRYGRFS